jgi:predicted Zn-dependent protease
MRRFALPVLLGLALGLLMATSAVAAHFSSQENSVDSGEIRYEDQTQWDGAKQHSIDTWNACCNPIDILKDDAFHVSDLEIKDYSANDSLCGKYNANTGANDMWLNNSYFNSATTDEKLSCAAHEMGHALGLGDHDETQYNDVLMDGCPVCKDPMVKNPQTHDKNDYDQLW